MTQEKPDLEQKEVIYEGEGAVQQSVGAIVTLIVGVGVAALVLIFVGTLGGKTYSMVEEDIDALSNESIKNYTKDGIVSAFEALEQTGGYLPIIVLAVIIFLVLGLILGMTGGLTYGGGYGGGAL